ncbi:hypothetical protein C7S15_1752 [Burkholderia cepacia]|nr:hypothetical protein [Burkholderia cepacia]
MRIAGTGGEKSCGQHGQHETGHRVGLRKSARPSHAGTAPSLAEILLRSRAAHVLICTHGAVPWKGGCHVV